LKGRFYKYNRYGIKMATTFDALSYSKQLKAVGVSPHEAEVHAESLSNALRAHSDQWATKTDLKELEYKLTIKLGAVVTVVVGAIATIAKFF
jgi:hypothetical protein